MIIFMRESIDANYIRSLRASWQHWDSSMTARAAIVPSERRMGAVLGMLAAFGSLAIDLYLPALPSIAASLGAMPGAVQLSVTVFLAGFMLGMLFCGPLSDRIGRRRVLLCGIALYALSSLSCMLAASVEQLIAARFIQALGGGAAFVLARAVARDLFPGAAAVQMLSMIAMVSAVGPLVAPLMGSGLMHVFGWRGTFGALLAWALLGLAVVWTCLPESLPEERRVSVPIARIFGVYATLLRDTAALGLLLAGGMSFAAMFAYITAGPFYFIELNAFTPTQYGLTFAANALGMFGANALNRRYVRRKGADAIMRIGCALGLAGALALLAAVLGHTNPRWVIGSLFIVVSVTGLLGANGVGLLMTRYPRDAGAAAALFGAAQFGFGALASVTVSLLHDGSARPMAWVIAAAAGFSLLGQEIYRRRVSQAKRVAGTAKI
jgi:DHA1 family bicyclomycin/chloramphenicol resistance-like MFS transporter